VQEFADTLMEVADEEEIPEDGHVDDLGQILKDAQRDYENDNEKEKLRPMIEDHRKLLYPDYKQGHKKLGTTLMLQRKAEYGMSDKAFEGMLKIVKDKLPENNELTSTTYEEKQTVCPLGLEVQKIHAYPNDCILYRGKEHENLEACPMCKALRYKIRRDDDPGALEGTPPKMMKVSAKGYVVFSYNTMFEAFVQEQRKC
jgi:rubrerythrin